MNTEEHVQASPAESRSVFDVAAETRLSCTSPLVNLSSKSRELHDLSDPFVLVTFDCGCYLDRIPPRNMLFERYYCSNYNRCYYNTSYDEYYDYEYYFNTRSTYGSTRSTYKDEFVCNKCIANAKILLNIDTRHMTDASAMKVKVKEVFELMGEREVWFSTSNSSVAVHWTTLLHYQLVDFNIDFGSSRILDRRSLVTGQLMHANKALEIANCVKDWVHKMDKSQGYKKEASKSKASKKEAKADTTEVPNTTTEATRESLRT